MPLERERIAISSQRNNDRYGKASSLKKVQQQGASRLVLRMYEDWKEPLDRDLLEIVKSKKAIATPPPKSEPKPRKAIAAPPPKRKPKPNATKPPKATEKRVSNQSIRNTFKNLLPQILYSDRAIGIQTIAAKSKDLGFKIIEKSCQEYLNQFAKEGIVFKAIAEHKYTAYALQSTDVIDVAEWLPAQIAYRIAVANGYELSYRFFKQRPFNRVCRDKVAKFYAEYGLEYRFGHKEGENHKWRVLNGNVS